MNDESYAVILRCGDDASKWAEEFVKMAKELGHSDIDESWVFSWFAAAIEHSSDVRRWKTETPKIYDWMNERNMKWPLDKNDETLFKLTWE